MEAPVLWPSGSVLWRDTRKLSLPTKSLLAHVLSEEYSLSPEAIAMSVLRSWPHIVAGWCPLHTVGGALPRLPWGWHHLGPGAAVFSLHADLAPLVKPQLRRCRCPKSPGKESGLSTRIILI